MSTDAIARERIKALEKHLNREEARLFHALDGFPQLYTLQSEHDALRAEIGRIHGDHVQRREMDDLKKTVAALETRVAVGPDDLRRLDHAEALRAGRQLGVASIFMHPLLTALLIVGGGIAGHFIK